MATKAEMEEYLNEALRTDIEWSELKKDDLETIVEGLDDEDFVKKFVAQYANTAVGEKVQDQVEDWEPGEGVKLIAAMQEGKGNPMDFLL